MDSSDGINPLLSSNKSSDFQLQVQLHPLVILTISDYVTRHALRRQKNPIIGAIIGAQNGKDITMEHAFECKTEQNKDGQVVLDAGWFHDRLQQYKDVHKAPQQLDLVGWFTLAPSSGPQPNHLPIHQQLLENYNESALFLTFHSTSLLDGSSKSGKLPITIYETAYEAGNDGDDKHMEASGDAGPKLVLRFKEVPYTVDTGEAEMIAIDFVAKGGANATVSNGVPSKDISSKADAKGKAKAKAAATEESGPDLQILSPEDEELIASLTGKANAIKMLQQRISLTKSYVNSIPPCYLNTPQSGTKPVVVKSDPHISHSILRSVSSTLSRLPLLSPPAEADRSSPTSRHTSTFAQESGRQKSDVALVSLLGSLGSTLRAAQDMGKKAGVVERARFQQSSQMQNAFGAGGKGKNSGSYPLRGFDDDHGGLGDMSAFTPPMESGYGDEGYMDNYDGENLGSAGSAGGVPLAGGTAWSALRGKGKGVLRGARRKPDEDEEMT